MVPDETANRSIQYIGQLAGIGVQGLMETFVRDEPNPDWQAWLGTWLQQNGWIQWDDGLA